MFFDFDSYSYYVRPGFTDARKSFRTLSCIVDEEMGLDSRGKAMFIFCNKAKNTLKILVWDDGYWVLKTTEFNQNRPLILTKRNITDFNQNMAECSRNTIISLSLAI